MALALLVLSIVGLIYLPWLSRSPLSSGDWPYLFAEQIREFPWFPEARNLWLAPYNQILTKFVVEYVGVSWEVSEKILWFFPFVILSAVMSFRAFRSWISVLVYTTNTYALMIVGGGQMGVAMAYALAPWTFTHPSFISIAIQAMFDPRIALLTVIASLFVARQNSKKLLLSLLGVFVVHLYWIVPVLRQPVVLGDRLAQVSAGMLEFLSFATFSQTISLLHPNWPENIFGKVYFMQPEFLLIPIIAFSIFLFDRKTHLRYGLLAIFGAFLAKGTQEPFGGIYAWLFTYVPGFWLFRDSTKFYLFIALSYAYLIPKSKIPSVLIVLVWAFLIRQAITHQLTGTFMPVPIDEEYIRLKDIIKYSPVGTPTYWVPTVSRYAFFSENHLARPGLKGPQGPALTIVPWDSRQEIFLTEREYNDSLRREYIASVSALPNLERDPMFTRLAVWKVK